MLTQLLKCLIPALITLAVALPAKQAMEYQHQITGWASAQQQEHGRPPSPEVPECQPEQGVRFNTCATLDTGEVIDHRVVYGEVTCPAGVTPTSPDHWSRCDITEHAA